jgi:hypothetical protein
MLVLHELLRDGTVRHGEMGRPEWNASLRNPEVSGRWAHRPDDCHDPVQRLFDQMSPEQKVAINDTSPELAPMGLTPRGAYLNSVAHIPSRPTLDDPSTKPPEKKPGHRDPVPTQASLF